jgi:hypothetical protein
MKASLSSAKPACSGPIPSAGRIAAEAGQIGAGLWFQAVFAEHGGQCFPAASRFGDQQHAAFEGGQVGFQRAERVVARRSTAMLGSFPEAFSFWPQMPVDRRIWLR